MKTELTALITGAANGIGKSTAFKFAKSNYKLFLVDISPKIHEVVDEINKLMNKTVAYGFVADVSDSDQVDLAFNEGMEFLDGRLDVLVNNAGSITLVDGKLVQLEQITSEVLLKQYALNVFSVFYFCRHAAPVMKKNGGGTIVNIGSVSAAGFPARNAHYSSSKAAVEGITKTLARELAPDISVVCVAPGYVDTSLIRKNVTPELQAITLERTITKQLIPAWEVANLILFVADEDSRNLTGQVLHINAGLAQR